MIFYSFFAFHDLLLLFHGQTYLRHAKMMVADEWQCFSSFFVNLFHFQLKQTRTKHPRKLQKTRKSSETCWCRTQGQGKSYEKNERNILNNAKKGGRDTTNSSNETTSATNNASNETTSVTNTATTRSNDTYVYGVGILAVVAMAACVFFAYKTFKPNNKKLINEKQDQPPKRRHML